MKKFEDDVGNIQANYGNQDIKDWCDIGNLKFQDHSATNVRRALESWESMARRVTASS